MMGRVKSLLRLIAGGLFLVLGIVGLAVPVLQGILFLLVGVMLLAPDIPIFRRILRRLMERFPRMARRARRFLPDFDE